MNDTQSLKAGVEKAYLVGINVRSSRPLLNIDDSLDELELLVDTAGMEVVGRNSQSVNQIDPATFVGSGKVEEIREEIETLQASAVIFDDELSPRHQRELEKRLGQEIKVLDRTTLILDIFAQHASTREGALQVELAQYEYRLPRLTRQWTHLARQAGGGGSRSGNAGVGLRGPGETQLEVDRREIGRKITKLKSDLENVRRHRSQHRNQREKSGIPVVALIGYTNAGKSTVLRTLSGDDIYVADQLFATLDPTTRRVSLPSGMHFLLTDTVGFIQKLPTTLVASFRATLEEVAEADLLLHIVDASHQNVEQHIESVEDTLAEIDIPDIPRILVWNKMDQCEPDFNPIEQLLPDIPDVYRGQVQISAYQKTGIGDLLEHIETSLSHRLSKIKILLPFERGDIASYLFDTANIHSHVHTPEGILLEAEVSNSILPKIKKYQVD